jgi:hypothetical protein
MGGRLGQNEGSTIQSVAKSERWQVCARQLRVNGDDAAADSRERASILLWGAREGAGWLIK